jgi:gliding motility-associated-like protein
LAQNLVPNNSFEIYRDCNYSNRGEFDSTFSISSTNALVPYWCNSNKGTPDFLHTCNTISDYSLPDDRFGNHMPRTGNAMMGAFMYNDIHSSGDYREYIQVKLSRPLAAGRFYHISFYVLMALDGIADKNLYSIDDIGAYLSPYKYFQNNVNRLTLPNVPQVNSPRGIQLNNKQDFTKIEGCYLAKGGEQWLTLGCFTPNELLNKSINLQRDNSNNGIAYYYFDDVSLTEIQVNSFLTSNNIINACNQSIATITAPSGYENYTWNTGEITQSINVQVSGTYVAVSSNQQCQLSIDTFQVNINGGVQQLLSLQDTILCGNNPINISANNGFSNYVWNNTITSQSISINQAGTYYIQALNVCNNTISDSIKVLQYAIPNLKLPNDTIICDSNYTIRAQQGFSSYTWNNIISNNNYLNITQSGTYILQATNPCTTQRDTVQVIMKQPVTLTVAPKQLLCNNAFIELKAEGNFEHIRWNNGDTNIITKAYDAGIYTVLAYNECGNKTARIIVDTCNTLYTFFVPNAFTPNSDGVNDVIKTYGINYELVYFEIWDRWGEKIFYTNDVEKGWDGRFKNQLMRNDMYIYLAEIILPGSNLRKLYKGEINLIR